jgi:hypothetical protein
MFESLSQILTGLADAKTLVAGSAAGVSLVVGVVGPKVGFGRACTLAFRSRVFSSLHHKTRSVRHEEAQQVWDIVSNDLRDGLYLVVTGPRGVGKSSMVSTTLHRRYGVVTISVRDTLYISAFTCVQG